jgi:poly [ADP-ribose] polymerase 2/3/4
VAGPDVVGTQKASKAESLGVDIWTEQQFLKALGGAAGGKKAAAKPKAKAAAKPKAAKPKRGAAKAASAKGASAGGQPLAGKTVVFSGKLSQTRANMQRIGREAGANVTGSVSGNTDILVAGSGSGDKMIEAEAFGTTVWTEDEFNDAIGAGGDESSDDEPAPKKAAPKRAAAKRAAPKKAAPKRAAVKRKAEVVSSDDDSDEDPEVQQQLKKAKLDQGAKKSGGKSVPVDEHHAWASNSSAQVYTDDEGIWACMLNQTNIAANNNKFYVIQLVELGGQYATFTRWGRVGERGQNGNKVFGDVDSAKKLFKSKFRAKSGNAWEARDNFVVKSGKYTLLEMSYSSDDSDDDVEMTDTKTKKKAKVLPCTLDSRTQDIVKLIFSQDMFNQALAAQFNMDTKKMPLGKLTHDQLHKGFEVLEEIEAVLDGEQKGNLTDLSGQFYTRVPHDFGRQRPPTISSKEALQGKFDMLDALGDVVKAQDLLKKGAQDEGEVEEVPHPIDVNYNNLNNDLTPLDKGSDEWDMIERYTNKTMGYRKVKVMDIFEVDREGEDKRFQKFKKLDNRKLLWHGTNIAVVVAILQGGLRIMPHSGGRVGRGLYFASENGKSAGYVGTCKQDKKNVGIMFLNEVALGKEHQIQRDDSSLRKAPAGTDSVHAMGRVEPDPAKDETIEGDYGDIVVPVGKPVDQGIESSFMNSEYLVYDEAQVRMKYMLKLEFTAY